MKLPALLALVFFACVGTALAQSQSPHVCGAGPGPNEVMAGMAPGGDGIAPTPLCYWKQGEQATPAQPQGYWVTMWGSLATDGPKGILGSASDMSESDQAESVAMEQCKEKGGGQCKIQTTYSNQCVALSSGDKVFFVKVANSEQAATSLALNRCSEEDENCVVYFSSCSLPQFIRY